MSVIKIQDVDSLVYVILGIDAHENDQVLAVCRSYEIAKRYCMECLVETEFYDVWIEKHPLF